MQATPRETLAHDQSSWRLAFGTLTPVIAFAAPGAIIVLTATLLLPVILGGNAVLDTSIVTYLQAVPLWFYVAVGLLLVVVAAIGITAAAAAMLASANGTAISPVAAWRRALRRPKAVGIVIAAIVLVALATVGLRVLLRVAPPLAIFISIVSAIAIMVVLQRTPAWIAAVAGEPMNVKRDVAQAGAIEPDGVPLPPLPVHVAFWKILAIGVGGGIIQMLLEKLIDANAHDQLMRDVATASANSVVSTTVILLVVGLAVHRFARERAGVVADKRAPHWQWVAAPAAPFVIVAFAIVPAILSAMNPWGLPSVTTATMQMSVGEPEFTLAGDSAIVSAWENFSLEQFVCGRTKCSLNVPTTQHDWNALQTEDGDLLTARWTRTERGGAALETSLVAQNDIGTTDLSPSTVVRELRDELGPTVTSDREWKTTVVTNGDDIAIVGAARASTIDRQDIPYEDQINSIVVVAFCKTTDCSANTVTAHTSTFPEVGTPYLSADMTATGQLVIGLSDGLAGAGTILTVDAAGVFTEDRLEPEFPVTERFAGEDSSRGFAMSLQLASTGLPVVLMVSQTNAAMLVLQCKDARCTTYEQRAVGGLANMYWDFSIIPDVPAFVLDAEDRPLIPFVREVSAHVQRGLIACDDASCSSISEQVLAVDWAMFFKDQMRIALDNDGRPVILFQAGARFGGNTVIWCEQVRCGA